jgi:hypothetical protein
MYCAYCGKEIADESITCTECGRQIRATFSDDKRWSSSEMASFIIGAIFIPLAGIAFGMLNMNKDLRKDQAVILIVLSAAVMIIGVICYYIWPFILMFLSMYFKKA